LTVWISVLGDVWLSVYNTGKQDSQCTANVILRLVRVTNVAVEKQ